MKVSVNLSIVALAMIIMAVSSLLIMVSLTQIDQIVHGDLYNFGLEFSNRWAMPYWINSGVIISLSLSNVVAAILLSYHLVRARAHREKERRQHSLGEYAKSPEKTTDTTGMTMQKSSEAASEEAEQLEELIEIQIEGGYWVDHPRIREYDVRHPKDVVDSQC